MREQSCSIPRGLKINKNSAEGEVFLVDFPSYRTLQAVRKTVPRFDLAQQASAAGDTGREGQVKVFGKNRLEGGSFFPTAIWSGFYVGLTKLFIISRF
jgi:hypothetical protein